MSLNCEDSEGGSGLDGDTLSQARLGGQEGRGGQQQQAVERTVEAARWQGFLSAAGFLPLPAISVSSRNPKEKSTADPACPSATNPFQTILEPPRVS